MNITFFNEIGKSPKADFNFFKKIKKKVLASVELERQQDLQKPGSKSPCLKRTILLVVGAR